MSRTKWILTAVLAATLILVPAVVLSQRQEAPVQAPQQSIPLNADTILTLVNNERQKAGLQPLVSDPRLVATAQGRANDMVARNYFSHNDPVTSKSLVIIKPTNPECIEASENISDGIYADNGDYNKNVVRSWMESKPHHDAILRADYTLTGVAISGTKVVQHFCVAI